jgi:hypothetical protein
MYWISDKDQAYRLIQQARDIETKIKSHCIEEDEIKKLNIYTEEDRQILEDIQISEIMNYEKATIIYSKTNLNEELDLIIEMYNYIPDILNHKYTITQIKFKKDDKDLILVVDPNIEHGMTYKDVRQLCNKEKIEFKNQSFSNLIKELKIRFLDTKQKDTNQPKKSEKYYLIKRMVVASCARKKFKKAFDIDHIIPLAEGGTNEQNSK